MDEPRIEDLDTIYIVGDAGRFRPENMHEVPKLWEGFSKKINDIPNKFGHTAYGLSYGFSDDGEMSYMAGTEVEHLDNVPEGMTGFTLEPQTYAVFIHDGHMEDIGKSWKSIFDDWFPKNYERIQQGAPMFERYGEDFNPDTGGGKVWLFVPIS